MILPGVGFMFLFLHSKFRSYRSLFPASLLTMTGIYFLYINYSKAGYECRHNYHIWKGMTYLGIGPAAASFDGRRRWTQIRDLNKWLEGAAAELDDIPEVNRLAEIVAFGFRTVNGWYLEELEELYGRNALIQFSDQFEELIEEGLLAKSDERIYPTDKGLLFADDIAESFLFIQ